MSGNFPRIIGPIFAKRWSDGQMRNFGKIQTAHGDQSRREMGMIDTNTTSAAPINRADIGLMLDEIGVNYRQEAAGKFVAFLTTSTYRDTDGDPCVGILIQIVNPLMVSVSAPGLFAIEANQLGNCDRAASMLNMSTFGGVRTVVDEGTMHIHALSEILRSALTAELLQFSIGNVLALVEFSCRFLHAVATTGLIDPSLIGFVQHEQDRDSELETLRREVEQLRAALEGNSQPAPVAHTPIAPVAQQFISAGYL
jgi:hypothetical protein